MYAIATFLFCLNVGACYSGSGAEDKMDRWIVAKTKEACGRDNAQQLRALARQIGYRVTRMEVTCKPVGT